MDDLETRELRYFVTIAEELHFGRAAGRLHVAQPALSKTVQRMEGRLGVQLFNRSSRSVTLTPAGRALLEHGRGALSAMSAAAESARRAAEREHVRLVIKPGGDANLLSDILAAYAGDARGHPVDIVFSGSADRGAFLREHRADVGLLYAPFDDLTGLAAHTLLVEGRVAVLPTDHPLAHGGPIGRDQLAQETFARWRDIALDRDADGPEVADLSELIALVRVGRAVTVLPRSLMGVAPSGVALVPVRDAEPSRIVIARRSDDERSAIISLVEAAVSARDAQARKG
jgi:DNA-binding transcriptional LysR family regulator